MAYGVMVAQVVLVHSVEVQIFIGQMNYEYS